MQKTKIVAELGEHDLLTSERISAALVANDEVKYYFALLQKARDHADHPSAAVLDLAAERAACLLVDDWLDDVVAGTVKGRDGYRVPHGPELLRRIRLSIEAMLACLPEGEQVPFRARLERLPLTPAKHGSIPGPLIDAMTSGDRKAGDSLHLLVMDAHRAINALQARTASETVAGARCEGLSAEGRARVEAFMAGLNRTAPLKFDHPGLGTTATEHKGLLLIQNDVGTTDAHVLVLRVNGLTASLTYTDVHRQRLAFFQELFRTYAIEWEGPSEHESASLDRGHYLLTTGTFKAGSEAELLGYLEHVGSRIVFLIDWNHMRKRLRAFVSKRQAAKVLHRAAEREIGHRALIEIGGAEALAEAVEYAAGRQLRYGQRLDDLIGEDRAVAFLERAMEIASRGLMQRRSRRSIRDELKASLRQEFETERLAIFETAARHAEIGHDIAYALSESFQRWGNADALGFVEHAADRASLAEQRADQLLNEAREDIKRFARPLSLLRFFERSDDAVDELEEAAALVSLASNIPLAPDAIRRLGELADLALGSTQQTVKCIACAATITRTDVQDDLDEFLTALEQLIEIEHAADDARRAFRRWLILDFDSDQRQLLLLDELCKALESVTDAHLHAGQMLRAYLIEEVIA